MNLEQFLQHEKDMFKMMLKQMVTEGYYEGDENWIKDHDRQLINKVLSEVQREVEKHRDGFYEDSEQATKDILTIIESLKVK